MSDQQTFVNDEPGKAVYFTECTGEFGSDWWSDIKWYMDNIFIGSPNYYAQTGAMWNLALDGDGEPKLPGTDSCGVNGSLQRFSTDIIPVTWKRVIIRLSYKQAR